MQGTYILSQKVAKDLSWHLSCQYVPIKSVMSLQDNAISLESLHGLVRWKAIHDQLAKGDQIPGFALAMKIHSLYDPSSAAPCLTSNPDTARS